MTILNRIVRLPVKGAAFVSSFLRSAILHNGDYVFIGGSGLVVGGLWRMNETFGLIMLGVFLMIGGYALMRGR